MIIGLAIGYIAGVASVVICMCLAGKLLVTGKLW